MESFQGVIDLIPYPVAVVRDNGIIIKINNLYEIFSGYSKQEIENKINYEKLVFNDSLKKVKFYHDLRSKDLHAPNAYKWKYLCKNNEVKDILAIVSKIPNSDLRFVIILDLAHLDNLSNFLHEENFIYGLVFRNSKSIMTIIDPETGKFIKANSAALNFYGYKENDFLNMNVWEISKSSEDYARKKFMDIINNYKDIPHEFEHYLSNGEIRSVEVHFTPIFWMKKLVVFSITHDITEKKALKDNLNQKVYSIVKTLTKVIEMRDPYTAGHQENVSKLAVAIAEEMGIEQEKIKDLEIAALLHDIGKIDIPAEILSKPTKLTHIEFELIKEHSKKGYEILKEVKFDSPIAEFVLQHHEKIDGSGYPHGIKGEEILLEAKIICVSDVVEAIYSHRPYRPALGIDAALEEIESNKGIKYDKVVVESCLRLFREDRFKF